MALNTKLLLLLLFFVIAPLSAQDTPQPKDTVKEKRDQMYKDLENYSKRKKFTKFVHKLIFRSVKEQDPSKTRKKVQKRTPEMTNTFTNYEGRIVRRIKIETLDPFGYSINDTLRQPDNWLEKFGNGVHLKT
ncbi:MAG: hypothetical protein EOO20_18790, partial [Chryseobacterium sp.]